jgi:hypothetical protein
MLEKALKRARDAGKGAGYYVKGAIDGVKGARDGGNGLDMM